MLLLKLFFLFFFKKRSYFLLSSVLWVNLVIIQCCKRLLKQKVNGIALCLVDIQMRIMHFSFPFSIKNNKFTETHDRLHYSFCTLKKLFTNFVDFIKSLHQIC